MGRAEVGEKWQVFMEMAEKALLQLEHGDAAHQAAHQAVCQLMVMKVCALLLQPGYQTPPEVLRSFLTVFRKFGAAEFGLPLGRGPIEPEWN